MKIQLAHLVYNAEEEWSVNVLLKLINLLLINGSTFAGVAPKINERYKESLIISSG